MNTKIMKLKPIGDNIIVKATGRVTQTASGIYIPETAKEERPEKGEVVAVGPGRLLDNGSRSEVEVEVGQKIIFKTYAPAEVDIEGVKHLVVPAKDVVAVIED